MPARPPAPAGGLSRRAVLGRAARVAALGATYPLLAACAGDDDEPATSAAPGPSGSAAPAARERTIRTCVYAKNHASSPLYWQEFAPDGVTVEVSILASAAEIQQALEKGDLDFGLMGAYNTTIAADQGTITSKIVGMVSRQGIGIVARKDRGIAAAADLAGKTVAVPPPGAQVLVLNALLEDAGLTLDKDVSAVPLAYADHVAALERGDVDAYAGTEPLCTQSIVSGTGVRLPGTYDTPLGDLNTALWASSAALKDPDLVRTAVAMQKAATEKLTPGGTNDKAVWQDLLVTQFGYDEAVYEAVLDNVGAEWRFDDTREAQFKGTGDLLLASGAIAKLPDYEALFARNYWDA